MKIFSITYTKISNWAPKWAATFLLVAAGFSLRAKHLKRSFSIRNLMKKTDKDEFKILFVCTGNTCRSPTAEGILNKMLKQKEIYNVEISSAGTYGLQNAPASLFAIEVARVRNVDLSEHRSRELTRKMVQQADLILAMSQEHLDFINRIDKKAGDNAYLLKAFPQLNLASNEDQKQSVLFIKDPIGGSLDDYEHSFLEIEKAVKRIFPKLISLATKG